MHSTLTESNAMKTFFFVFDSQPYSNSLPAFRLFFRNEGITYSSFVSNSKSMTVPIGRMTVFPNIILNSEKYYVRHLAWLRCFHNHLKTLHNSEVTGPFGIQWNSQGLDSNPWHFARHDATRFYLMIYRLRFWVYQWYIEYPWHFPMGCWL